MIRTGEIQEANGQIQFSLAVADPTPLRPKLGVDNANAASVFPPDGINLSGSQLLVGFLYVSCTVGFMLWAFIQLWLFEK